MFGYTQMQHTLIGMGSAALMPAVPYLGKVTQISFQGKGTKNIKVSKGYYPLVFAVSHSPVTRVITLHASHCIWVWTALSKYRISLLMLSNTIVHGSNLILKVPAQLKMLPSKICLSQTSDSVLMEICLPPKNVLEKTLK